MFLIIRMQAKLSKIENIYEVNDLIFLGRSNYLAREVFSTLAITFNTSNNKVTVNNFKNSISYLKRLLTTIIPVIYFHVMRDHDN